MQHDEGSSSLSGRTIGPYRIEGRLGRGGMGVVYRALDVRLERPVALKFLTALLSEDEVSKERLLGEARAASAIDHPNVCGIYAVDETTDGTPFIVMPLYEGETLADKLKSGHLTSESALAYVLQTLEGLSEAHRLGIVHRDLKPANLFVTRDDTLKILDFGLAHKADSERLTRPDQRPGTIGYMSPEQLSGKEVDPRSDLWSIGVILYRLAAGRMPFAGPPSVVMERVLKGRAAPFPSTKGSPLPRIEKIIQKSLSVSPDDRYQSAGEMMAALRAISSEHGTGTNWISQSDEHDSTLILSPSDPVTRTRASPRRKLTFLVSSVALALTALLLVVVGFRSHNADRGPSATVVADEVVRVGVLAPEHSDQEISDWPRLIQTLLSNDLTGRRGLAVTDPVALNGIVGKIVGETGMARSPELFGALTALDLDLVIDMALRSVSGQPTLELSLIVPETAERRYSQSVILSGEAELPGRVRSLAEGVLGYIQVEILSLGRDPNLSSWVSVHEHDVEAVRLFMQAAEFAYRFESGGGRYLRRALEIDPEFIVARLWLISGLVAAGEEEEARHHLDYLRAREGDASPAEQAMIGWAGAYLEGDLVGQAGYLEVALGYTPNNFVLLSNLAWVRYQLNDCTGAAATAQPMVDAAWAYPPVYWLVGECLIRLGRASEAYSTLESVAPHIPPNSIVTGLLEGASHLMGKRENAARYQEEWQSIFAEERVLDGPWRASVFKKMAEICTEKAILECTVSMLRKAVSYSPADVDVRIELARVLREASDFSQAGLVLQQALEDGVESAAVHLELGRVLEAQGADLEARFHYRRFLELEPESPLAPGVRNRLGLNP